MIYKYNGNNIKPDNNTFDVVAIIKTIVMRNKFLSKKYDHTYPNQQYELTDIITEIIYVLQTGISWNKLRSNIHPRTLQRHHYYFSINNIYKKAYKIILKKYLKKIPLSQLRVISVDTSFLKNINATDRIGRNVQYKSKKGRKISIICDMNGIPLSILVSTGNNHDSNFLPKHLNDLKKLKLAYDERYFCGDAIYSSINNKKIIKENDLTPIIAYNKRNTKDEQKILENKMTEDEKEIYKKRIKSENSFCWLKKNKRIEQCYEKKYMPFLGFVWLAYLRIILKRI